MATAKQKREALLESMRQRKLKSQEKKALKKKNSLEAKIRSEEQKKILNKEIAALQATEEQKAQVKALLLAEAQRKKYANKKHKIVEEASESEDEEYSADVAMKPVAAKPSIPDFSGKADDIFGQPLVKDKPLPALEPLVKDKYTNLVPDDEEIAAQDAFSLNADLTKLKTRQEIGESAKETVRLSVSKDELELLDLFKKQHPESLVERTPEIEAIRATLPVLKKENQIVEAIVYSDVVIISADTGAGKTTQVPQFIYEKGFSHPDSPFSGNIMVTQPRRIAVETMAKRVAEEMNVEIGKKVGFQTKYDCQLSKETKIFFKTDGILLLEIINDPILSKYSCVVLDEAHERGVNTDILISLLSLAVSQRRKDFNAGAKLSPLKLVIMSATCDTEVFTDGRLFKIHPTMIEVEGRTFDITDHHEFRTATIDDEIETLAAQTARTAMTDHESGNCLIFLPGKAEINRCINLLHRDPVCREFDIYPLYSGIKPEIQEKIFSKRDPETDNRMIVVSTNVAETSLTIPNIRIVIDSGREKRKVFDSASSVSSIETGFISRASALQRRGRAGRVAPGHLYRLYTQAAFGNFDQHPIPEIMRTPLETVVLQLKAIGISDIGQFTFPSEPRPGALRDAARKLRYIAALDSRDRITPLGRSILRLPVDVKVGRFLVYAQKNRESDEKLLPFAILMASVLSNSHSLNSGADENAGEIIDRHEKARIAAQRAKIWQESSEGDVICYARALLYAKSVDFDYQKCELMRIDPKIARDLYISAEHLTAHISEIIELTEDGAHTPSLDDLNDIDPLEKLDSSLSSKLRSFLLSGFIDHIAYSSGINSEKNLYHIRNNEEQTWILHKLSALYNAKERIIVYCNANQSHDTTILSMCTPISVSWIPLMASQNCELVTVKPERDPELVNMSYGGTNVLFSAKLKKSPSMKKWLK